MMTKQSISIFSGAIELNSRSLEYFRDFIDRLSSDDDVWKFEEYTLADDDRVRLQSLYYDSLIDSIYPSEELRLSSGICKSTRQWSVEINREVKLQSSGDGVAIFVKRLRYLLFSSDLLLFSIEIDNAGKNLNEITKIGSIISAPNRYSVQKLSNEFYRLFLPLIYMQQVSPLDIFDGESLGDDEVANIFRKLLKGNKLYTYSVIQLEEGAVGQYYNDNTLYEIGNHFPIGVTSDCEHNCFPDEGYKQKILCDNKIACFDNWRALALNDVVCMLAKPSVPGHALNSWMGNYFDLIYINAFYLKCYLAHVNKKYQRIDVDDTIYRQFVEFDKIFNLHKISYNFLPQMIYDKLCYAFDLSNEWHELQEKITRYNDDMEREHQKQELELQKQEIAQDKRLSKCVLFLSCLTIFSALSDGMGAADYISEICTQGLDAIGYVRLAIIVVVLVVAVYVFIELYPRKKK